MSLSIDSAQDMLAQLNPPQQEAVTSTEGPLLILAGAGSGKTRALTYRVAYLIKKKKVNPRRILAITFTNKAADGMRERIETLIGDSTARGMWVSTFHSACVRILRSEIDKLGLKRHFAIYDDRDGETLVNQCLKDLNIDPKRYAPRAVAARISSAKNELIDPDTFGDQAETHFDRVVSEVYHLYQERLAKNNCLDFDDLIMLTVNIFELYPDVLEKYQDRFRYILVDEYQDTNHAQFRLVSLLASKHRNLCVVGDPDQSIYQFRGANIRNILEFESDFPNAKIINLEQNYRSTQAILDAANEVIRNNRGRKPKKLWTANDHGCGPVWYQADDERDEASYVATQIELLRRQSEKLGRAKTYKDFAVFYRTNAQSRVLEEVFLSNKLPYKIVGGVKFYDRMEIKDILAYLKVLQNREEEISLKRIINVPKRGIGKTTVERVDNFAAKNNLSFSEALAKVDEIGGLSGGAQEKIKDFLTLIDQFTKGKTKRLADLVEDILKETGYLRLLEQEETVEAESRVENVKEFAAACWEFEEEAESGGLEGFLERVALITDIDTYEERADTVTLMTLHNAKGLEFPVVFMVGMEEGLFPHIRSMTNKTELEEERRLCYVGLTRAQEALYLTSAWSRSLYGESNYSTHSRFLKEIPEHLLELACPP